MRLLLGVAAVLWSACAFAQDGTPTVSTAPENPAETDEVTLVVRGFFPSTDYAVTSATQVLRFDVPPAAAHGANEVEFSLLIHYRHGPLGGQALTPYEARFPVGRFPRFSRIKVSTSILCDTGACPSWFAVTPYTNYVYVRNPQPPRLEVQPAAPTSTDSVRVTMRWYYTKYYASRISSEIEGRLIRIRQDVSYVGPDDSANQASEGQVTHELGKFSPGTYQLEWHQTVSGQNETIVAAIPLTIGSNGGTCTACGTQRLAIETTSLDFDGFPLGVLAGPQAITVAPQGVPLGISPPPPPPPVTFERIWTNNLDFVTSHDCPARPATLAVGRTCTVTVFYNGTLRGANTGTLFVRYSDILGVHTATVALGGRTIASRGINFVPQPITPDTAVEYYASALDHYFFTSSPAEQQFVDQGGAGAWQRTGHAFPVGGPADVCRFYGDRSGPNSHFYTGNAAECAQLRQIDGATPPGTPAWRYEGIALKAEMPAPDPTRAGSRLYCIDQDGRFPIYRLYNDGAARGIDSNHRHVAARGTLPGGRAAEDVVRDMMGAGWIYEGNALCN